MVHSRRPRRWSVATPSSNYRGCKRLSLWRPSSCSSTRSRCRAGKACAKYAHSPPPARDASVWRMRSMTTAITDAHRAVVAVWRIEQPRLITSLARILRDVPLAEDLTQEALLAAIERWPATGVPERPGAWLMTTAKRRALDHLRRNQMLERKHRMIAQDMQDEEQAIPDPESFVD